jgi:hypothetical protein
MVNWKAFGRTEEDHGVPQYSRCPGRHSSCTPPEPKYVASPLPACVRTDLIFISHGYLKQGLPIYKSHR